MPTISIFYGILIRISFRDIEKHKLHHIHGGYQGQTGKIIGTSMILCFH